MIRWLGVRKSFLQEFVLRLASGSVFSEALSKDMSYENPDSSSAGMTTKVARGSLWSLGGQGATIVASLVATPFVIRLLGSEAYGVLALVNVALGYLAFTDFGMAVASTRFAADRYARGDREGEVAIIWTSLLVMLIPTVAAAALFSFAARPLAVQILRLPEHLQQDAVMVFRLAALAFMAKSAAGVLNTPLLVHLRLDLYTLVHSGTNTGQVLLVPVVLLLGGGLVSAVAVMAGASLVCLGLLVAISARQLPWPSRSAIRPSLVGPLLRFGGTVTFIMLAGTFLFHIEKPLLASLCSVKALGHYAVAFTLARTIALLPGSLNQSLLPALSRLQAGSDRSRLEQVYGRAVRGLLLWSLPAAMILWVVARPFLRLWAGSEFASASLIPLQILLVGAVFDGVSYAPRSFLEAVGKPHLLARCQLVEVVPFFCVAYFVIGRYGAAGAAAMWSLRAMVESVWVYREAYRVSGFKSLPFANRSGFIGVLTAVALPVLATEVMPAKVEILVSVVAFSLAIYLLIAWRAILSSDERKWVLGMVRELTRRQVSEPTS